VGWHDTKALLSPRDATANHAARECALEFLIPAIDDTLGTPRQIAPANHPDSASGRKWELQQLFSGWHEPIADFLESTDENEILKNGRNIVTRMLPARLIERNLRRVYSYAA
jgi:hypothetical protein